MNSYFSTWNTLSPLNDEAYEHFAGARKIQEFNKGFAFFFFFFFLFALTAPLKKIHTQIKIKVGHIFA